MQKPVVKNSWNGLRNFPALATGNMLSYATCELVKRWLIFQ